VCLQCCGLWFDAEELERLLELPGPIFHTSRLQYTGSEPTRRPCPACGVAMRGQEIRPGGSVFDRCPGCRGLWLDFHAIGLLRDELVGPDENDDEVIERLQAQVRQALHAAHEAWQDRRKEQTRQAMEALEKAGGFPAPDSGAAAGSVVWQVAEEFAPFPISLLLNLLGLARGLLEMVGSESEDPPSRHGRDHNPPDWDKPWF
jgi:Zn-finger nucleic acid-binding protein